MAYGTNQGLIDYLATTGRTMPTGADPDVVRAWGSIYVNMWEDRYLGVAVALPDSFPRDMWPVVPVSVEYAAYEAGYAWSTGTWNGASAGGTAGGQVIKERVDVLEVQYAAPQDGSSWWINNRYIIPLAYALLQPFMKPEATNGCSGAPGSAFVV